jgi:Flp pilus assembly protein TadG
MQPAQRPAHSHARGERGQIIVIAALVMIAMIGGVSLVLEGGNAYAHQRMAQNALDSVANAGATVLAERLGGALKTDADVEAAMDRMASNNDLSGYTAWYTNVTGGFLNTAGTVVGSTSAAAQVGPDDGDTTIPPGTQGVRASGSQTFGTTFARVLGFDQFTASADATAVTGALTGGFFLPVVFPVSMANCDGTGDTVQTDAPWRLANPGTPHPDGQEWLVPLCKSGGGSFMILDLDPNKDCYQEVADPSAIQFYDFPVDIHVDTGNDCAKKVEEAVTDMSLQGKVVLIPICDDQCSTQSGTNADYHIIRIAAFWLDYLSYSNSTSNPPCSYTTSPTYGSSLVNITGGNGSSSCMAGWFVRYVTSGPVGSGAVNDGDAIGVQLIR